jgi:hypothetical protein
MSTNTTAAAADCGHESHDHEHSHASASDCSSDAHDCAGAGCGLESHSHSRQSSSSRGARAAQAVQLGGSFVLQVERGARNCRESDANISWHCQGLQGCGRRRQPALQQALQQQQLLLAGGRPAPADAGGPLALQLAALLHVGEQGENGDSTIFNAGRHEVSRLLVLNNTVLAIEKQGPHRWCAQKWWAFTHLNGVCATAAIATSPAMGRCTVGDWGGSLGAMSCQNTASAGQRKLGEGSRPVHIPGVQPPAHPAPATSAAAPSSSCCRSAKWPPQQAAA